MTTRRAFLTGLATLVAAPAVIRTPGLLMPVRRIAVPADASRLALLERPIMLSRWITRDEAVEIYGSPNDLGDPLWSPAEIAAMRSRTDAPLLIKRTRA